MCDGRILWDFFIALYFTVSPDHSEWERNMSPSQDKEAGVVRSVGEYQADEQAGVARLSWRVSGR